MGGPARRSWTWCDTSSAGQSAGGPVLLRIERNSGRSGAGIIKSAVEQGADRYAFALAHTAHGP
jgi:protease II